MVDWTEAAKKGELIAAGVNTALAVALIATRRWWKPAQEGQKSPPSASGPSACSRWGKCFGLALVAVLLLAGGVRWRFAHSSLWWDEVWQTRNATLGDWKPDKKHPGQLKFVETKWTQALWMYRKPTNHAPAAVTGKLSHKVWEKLSGAKPGEVSEFALRFPCFLASMAGIAGVALLLRAWGRPGVGLVAALLLALHPWHVRYGIDARGYAFVPPAAILGLWALWQACGRGPQSGRAGWWWTFGGAQAVIMWSHPLSLWVCAALALTGFIWIRQHRPPGARLRPALRLMAVQVAGAMLFLQLYLPQLMQSSQWGRFNQDGNRLGVHYILKTLSEVATGREWVAKPEYTSDPATAAWLHAVVGLVAMTVFASIGFIAMRRAKWVGFLPLTLLTAGATALVAITWAVDGYFYHRFVFGVGAPVLVAMAFGILEVRRWAWRLWQGSYPERTGSLVLRFAWMILLFHYGVSLLTQEETLARTPYAPLRETAAELRQAEKEGAATFGVGFGAEALQYYHPALPFDREPQSAAASLDRALANARAAGRELLVAISYEDLNRKAMPDVFTRLDDPALFTPAPPRPALEPEFATQVFRSVPESK